MNTTLTQDRLMEVLDFNEHAIDPKDRWRWKMAVSNRATVGSSAGFLAKGSRYIGIDGQRYNVRRLEKLWRTGVLPEAAPVAPKVSLTHEWLLQTLSYDKDTGVMTWLVDRSHNTLAGSIAGSINGGYRRIKLGSRSHRANRIAHFWMTGEWPKGEMDHINGVKPDDRWLNLRDVTTAENAANKRSTVEAGYRGVYAQGDMFVASMICDGEEVATLVLETPEEAAIAYGVLEDLLPEFASISST